MERSIFSDLSSMNESRLTFREVVSSAAAVKSSRVPPEPKHDPYSMCYLYSALFATILEDAIMELRILDECNSTLRVMKVHSDYSKLVEKKYGIKERPVVDELDKIDEKDLEKAEYKINKIYNDRTSVIDVILTTYQDLCLNQTYAFVVDTVSAFEEHDRYIVALDLEEASNRSLRRDLAKKLRQNRNHMKTVQYDTDASIDLLRREMEDNHMHAASRGRYASKWQKARLEQHHQSLKDKEGPAAEQLEYYKQQIDQEQRIHQEAEMLINIVTNEMLEKIEEWMTKYDTDMEAADLKIQIMKNRFQSETDNRIELENKYAKHEELMQNWIDFKDQREKANAYIAKMTNSAIIVQAWWRGLLVRLELGPYKVFKKKGGGWKKKK